VPNIAQHHSHEVVKMLLIGDSGCGKTASLLGLAEAGYNLRILDFDNGLDIVSSLLHKTKEPEEIATRIQYITCTDKMKTTKGGEIIPDGAPKGYATALKMMNHWKEDDGTDLGNVSEWGSNDVLVIDSLTFLSNAVMRWHLFNVGRVGNPWQSDWLVAQRRVVQMLELLFSESLRCNVVMTAHIRYVDIADGQIQGYPESVGKALPPQIPRYFNTVVQAKIAGSGTSAKRKIRIVPDTAIGLKNAAPHAFSDKELPLESGLADIFKAIRGSNPK
jgi:hypothetical protein